MVLLTAAERRSPHPVAVVPVRFTAPDADPTPLSTVPRDLHLTYTRTELCRDCGKAPALRSVYPPEFRYHLITGLLRCWACGQRFFKLKNTLEFADSVARNLRSDALDAVRYHERRLSK